MYTKKNLPKSQYELTKGEKDKRFSRADDVRRDDDRLKELTIGFYDIDNSIKWYFDNVIKPEVDDFGSKVPVPVVYGSPEKWKNMQADGYFRDVNGKIQTPLIAYKRTGIVKNKTLGSKVDGNFPQLFYTEEIKYDHQNKYDQFSKLTNSKPIKSFVKTVIPEYVDVTYDVVIWTDFVEHMNNLVESIIYSEGSYWGELDKFKFRTKIDNYTNTTDLLATTERTVRTSFQLTIYGYIVPDVMVKNLSKKSDKEFDSRQIVIDTEVDMEFQDSTYLSPGTPVSSTPEIPLAAPNPYSPIDLTISNYLNVNIAKLATTVSVPNTATFTATFLTAPAGLPATSVTSFMYFINGVYVEPLAITSFIDNGNGTCTLVFNVSELGFNLATTDEIVAVGKFA